MKGFKRKIRSKNITVKTFAYSCLSKDIDENIEKIKCELGNPSDLVVNVFEKNNFNELKYTNIYIETLVDKKSIDNMSSNIMELYNKSNPLEVSTPEENFNILIKYSLSFRKTEAGSDFEVLISNLLFGKAILLVDGCDKFISIDVYSTEGRSIEEPTTQSVIYGPKEGFIEKSEVNISLVRKRLKTKDLRVENLTLGSMTNTKIKLMYIDKIARKDIFDEVRRRLNNIKIDAVLDGGNIEELIKDDRYSIFPELLSLEKPDSVAANLLEGKVAIFVDGSSFVLTAPALFVEFLQVSEDYYMHFLVSTFFRMIRYIATILTLFVPSLYISLITFHKEMIPTPLLISIAAQREGVPFPALIEALLMESVFEVLREAGIRMPRVIGPAISIVGALVLGQAAVEAGIVSAFMVIIVSITAISSFAISNYSLANAVRIIRLVLMVLAGMYGLYGVFMGAIALVLHISKLKSIGIPYVLPIAPKIKYATKDTIIRYPLWSNKTRPVGISGQSSPRIDEDSAVSKKDKEIPEF